MNRRSFLKKSSLVTILGQAGYASLMDSILRKKIANASGNVSELFYLALEMPGGPPRWHFDLPLNPTGKSSDFKAGGFGTQLIKKGADWNAEYRIKKMAFGAQQIYLPPVWNLSCASTGNKINSLLPHTLMIRGVDMEINNHGLNRTRTVKPFASEPSTTGLIADRSGRPFPAVGHSTLTTNALNSPEGGSSIVVSKTKPIPSLTAPFKGKYADKEGVSNAENLFLKTVEQEASFDGYFYPAAKKTRIAAQELFTKDLDKYEVQFSDLLKKYTAIVEKNYQANFPGITAEAKKIKPMASGKFEYVKGQFLKASTLQGTLAKAQFPLIAHAFALAELLIKENLSSSMTLSLDGSSLRKGTGISSSITHDQHNAGEITSCFITSLYFRAVASCLAELTAQLKSISVFDKTVIHLVSEFSRNPRKDGSGSDHGFKGSNTTIISGMIKEPGLIGNIRKNDSNTRVDATWGLVSNMSGLGRPFVNDDIVNSICEMMEIPKITTKGQSLVKKEAGQVTLRKKWGFRNV